MDTSEVLYGAAAHVARYGLHKRTAYLDSESPSTSPACTFGAIGVAARAGGGDVSGACGRGFGAMADYLGTIDVPGWNDAPERTAGEVVEALTAAAVIAAAEEIDVRVVTA